METLNLDIIVDAAIADTVNNPADASDHTIAMNRHDPSLVELVSNPGLVEFKQWYKEQRKLTVSKQTEIKMSNYDLLWTTAPWFDWLSRRYGWLDTQHIDALLNLILSKLKRVPEKFADNWTVIETYLWGTLQSGQVGFSVRNLVTYVLGTCPKMLKRSWAKVEKIYGISNAVVSNEDTPQQTNNHDCGIMALKILECLCVRVSIHVIDPAKCGQYRNDYTAALFQLIEELCAEEQRHEQSAVHEFATLNRRTRRGRQH
ncbi:hypothetical protein C2S52_007342 [Perilla frutescens var. hirtella]|nr:hypothetical protein C2S52_007342 [Perilla frutescens var. hirtella]